MKAEPHFKYSETRKKISQCKEKARNRAPKDPETPIGAPGGQRFENYFTDRQNSANAINFGVAGKKFGAREVVQ